MNAPVQSRRVRLREATSQEIKTVALRQLAASGTAAVSLRAIARDMGMTAGAIYSYYDTRDALISALIADVYTSLNDTLEVARDSRPADDTAGRVIAYGTAYREWAVGRPEEFRLIYGDPAPDYQAPVGGAVAEAGHRACVMLTGIVADAWPSAGRPHDAEADGVADAGDGEGGGEDGARWSDFHPDFAALIRASFPDLPPAAVALSLRVWGRLHGLVALEVYGHLRPQVRDPRKLYHGELLDLTERLGLAADRPART